MRSDRLTGNTHVWVRGIKDKDERSRKLLEYRFVVAV